MIIGLDLSVIQTPHRMRGIGATAINFVRHIPDQAKEKHKFVLFLYEENQDQALSILNLKNLDYEVRTLSKPKRVDLKLPGKLKRLNSILNSLRDLTNARLGDRRQGDMSGINTYLQFDQMQALPSRKGMQTAVILYDIIPYVMEADYLWTYKTARHHGDSRKSSIRKALLRRQYVVQLKAICRSANKLVAISEHTKQDFVDNIGIPKNKIKVIHLGIENHDSNSQKDIEFSQYVENSWGYLPKKIDLTEKPYVLFVGGADPRRRLIDLVAAYNNLKAQGTEIRLVLAGDTMKGPKAIPVPAVQKYISNSSYLNDIVFLGFVTDEQREWLYENALAFIYPSVYEGFGLPVLEAMQYGTPVITYKNSSIYEVAQDAALYASDHTSIKMNIENLLSNSKLRSEYENLGKKQASRFSWERTTDSIMGYLN